MGIGMQSLQNVIVVKFAYSYEDLKQRCINNSDMTIILEE